MQRRELIKTIAALTGCAFVGAERLFAATTASSAMVYTAVDIALFDEIAETILPRTDTPGAKDAQVGSFIARYSAACYTPAQLTVLRDGMNDIDARMRKRHGVDFLHANAAQGQALLTDIDAQAKKEAKARPVAGDEQPPHYFSMLKQLALLGFFTSEPGATRVARYRPIPGPYKGVVPYKKGETFWVW